MRDRQVRLILQVIKPVARIKKRRIRVIEAASLVAEVIERRLGPERRTAALRSGPTGRERARRG